MHYIHDTHYIDAMHEFHTLCTLHTLNSTGDWRSRDTGSSHRNAIRRVWTCAPAMQNDDRSLQSAATATKCSSHILTTMRKYCAWHTERFSTRYQTCWNVRKYNACHAKRQIDPTATKFLYHVLLDFHVWSCRGRHITYQSSHTMCFVFAKIDTNL